MRRLGVALLVLVGCYTQRTRAQISAAARMSGAELIVQGGPVDKVHEFRVRAYADSYYRAHAPHWKDKFKERIARVNRFLEPELGARLVVEDLRNWDHRADDGDMEGMLEELTTHDPGADVDWVIGLVAAPPAVTSSIHKMGVARLLSKHMVLRTMDDAAEARAIESSFTMLTAEEKLAVYNKRKAHKEEVIFVHEWAHTLGAIHANDRAWIMNTSYDADQRAFSEVENRFLRLSLAARAAPANATASAEAELLRFAETASWDEWSAGEREVMVRVLRERASASGATAAVASLRKEDRDAYLESTRLAAAGAFADAWAQIAPLAAAQTGDATVQLLACQLAAQEAVTARESRAACERALALAPTDPLPAISLAWARLHDGDRKGALAAAAKGAERLEGVSGAAARWASLGAVYQGLSALTLAEQAAGKAGDANGAVAVRDWAADTRRWAAPPAGLAAEGEPDYLDTFWKLYQSLSPADAKANLKAIQAALRAYPGAPGLLALRCAAEVYADKLDAAERTCEQALQADDHAIFAHLTAAHVARVRKHTDAARTHLEKVLALDPKLEQAWQALAEISTPSELVEIKSRYRKLVGRGWPY